jgi:glycosyltransferase involved in cell wall biosynthesis
MLDQMAKRPKVSVCVLTYNQEHFVRQCLQSIIDQQAPFAMEIIVGDDCSTDGTRNVVLEYAARYPALIKPILHEQNLGANKNYLLVHSLATGDYVAHLDGDDYLLPGKLKTQADFLDQHARCSMVAHRMLIADESGRIVGSTAMNPAFIDMKYLLLKHPAFLHSSIMRRRQWWIEPSDPLTHYIDFYIYIHLALCGEIGFLNEPYGVYRQGVGISASLRHLPHIMGALDYAQSRVTPELYPIVKLSRSHQCMSYAINYLLRDDVQRFNSSIVMAKHFAHGLSLVHVFFLFRAWPKLLKPLIVLYKYLHKLKRSARAG